MKIMEKYKDLHDEDKIRAIIIKEQRAELVKHHLWVLWTDYFKPEHLEKFPNLHDLFWKATKQAGNTKKSVDPAEGQKLLDMIAEIDDIFKQTKTQAK
jgi:nickel superoxide dismutase